MTNILHDIFAASEPSQVNGLAVLIITADNTQDLEFFYPYYRFVEAGYRVDVATPHGGAFKGKGGMGLEDTKRISDVSHEDYVLLYIPGGKAPEELKKDADALKLTQQFAASGKPIAAICHGPQVLAAAGLVKGRKVAAWPDVEAEIAQAGGTFVNEPSTIDGQFITARWPGDLPLHMATTLQALQSGETRLPSGSKPRMAVNNS